MSNENFGVELEVISRHHEGNFGDPAGFEELLYSTKTDRSYLLVGKGGYNSKYALSSVRELTRRQAQDYLIELKGEEEAYKLIPMPIKKSKAKKPVAKKTTTRSKVTKKSPTKSPTKKTDSTKK